ncbi:MAG: M55 family metallopeptidase [Thermodesulfobacteriota bacterium]|nr:M55 family metallopeptidase [Thermodesulfobacteriota bacterium]
MHVGVFADIEGSFGIWRMRQCRMGTAEWQYGRSCLTADVNHVIQGAFDGGADKVTVKDTHEVGFNCLVNKLDPRADYRGGHYVKPSFFGNISGLDLVLYVAIHAASGTPNAFFPHTHYGIFSKVRINRKPVGEMDIYGGYLGEYGIPIGFVSGENIAVKQAQKAVPWAKGVVVDKRKETYTSGEKSRAYLSEGREQLRITAAQAVRCASGMKPLRLKGPLLFEAEFRSRPLADKFNTWGFKQTGTVVTWKADNMIQGFDRLNQLTFFPKRIYPFRRPLLFTLRQYYRIKTTYFAPSPNSEGATA